MHPNEAAGLEDSEKLKPNFPYPLFFTEVMSRMIETLIAFSIITFSIKVRISKSFVYLSTCLYWQRYSHAKTTFTTIFK